MSEDEDLELIPTPDGLDLNPAPAPREAFDENAFMQLMNEGDGVSPEDLKILAGANKTNQRTTLPNGYDPAALPQPDVNGMSKLLEKLNETSDYNAEAVIAQPEISKPLRQAVISESFSDKEWQIQLTETSSGKTLYNVINERANKSFFTDLYLQQSAKNLCNLLENGQALNSKQISTVLYYDEIYRKNYEEMKSLKENHRKAKAKGMKSKAAILESKFNKAKDDAKIAMNKQKRLL